MRIQVDPAKLASMGLSMEDIRGVIAATTVNQPTGATDGAPKAFNVYPNDQIPRAAPWNDMVLAWRICGLVRVRDGGGSV